MKNRNFVKSGLDVNEREGALSTVNLKLLQKYQMLCILGIENRHRTQSGNLFIYMQLRGLVFIARVMFCDQGGFAWGFGRGGQIRND